MGIRHVRNPGAVSLSWINAVLIRFRYLFLLRRLSVATATRG